MALSTAEAELTAIVEGLQSGRSVRSLVNLLFDKVDLEIFNDNRAAVVLASGAGGGWRTRHLRIRASCLAESLKVGETTLSHRAGTSLWADGLTKPLPTQVLSRFCRGIWLGDPSLAVNDEGGRCETQVIATSPNVKMLKSLSLLVAGAALLPQSRAAETCEIKETRGEQTTGSWADQGWLLMLAGLVCFLHFIKEMGWELAKKLFSKKEQLKVKLLDDQASLPTRASSQAAGWDLASSCYVELKPGERKLVPLGISVELPAGCYGRIASRSSFALRGIDVAGGVIDPDYRGEVKIILVNNGMDDLVINAGDRIGQLVLERFAVVEAVSSRALSSTERGDGGFGSSGVAARRLSRVHSDPHKDIIAEPLEGETGHTEDIPASPSHAFFEGVYTARSGETMIDFVTRLKNQELYEFRWMFPPGLMAELFPDRLHGAPMTFNQKVLGGTIQVLVHRHSNMRKKLFDSEASAPPPRDGITAGVVTLGWAEDGMIFARVDNRRGSRSMCYLKSQWKGMSLFFSWLQPLGSSR